MKDRVLLLYLKTGGGHLSAARALADKISSRYGDSAEPVFLDGIPEHNILLKKILVDGYHLMNGVLKPWWTVLFILLRLPLLMDLTLWSISRLTSRFLAEQIRETRAARIVILHYLMSRAVSDALDLLGKDLPVVTVVLDPISVHPIWFREKRFRFILFSDEARRTAIETGGVSPGMVSVHHPILHEKFSSPLTVTERETVRRNLGFTAAGPLVLIAGGGEGLRGGAEIFKYFLRRESGLQIALVAGKSRKLKAAGEAVMREFPDRTARVYGFIDFMYELMNAADLIITKGGPATIMEALLLGKPIILSDYMYGQEAGNVEFVETHEVGMYLPRPRDMHREAMHLLGDRELYEETVKRIGELRLSIGTGAVAEEILFDRSGAAV